MANQQDSANEQVFAYVDGELIGEEREAFEAHLQNDDGLRQAVDEAFRLNGMMRAAFRDREAVSVKDVEMVERAAAEVNNFPIERPIGLVIGHRFEKRAYAVAASVLLIAVTATSGFLLGSGDKEQAVHDEIVHLVTAQEEAVQNSLEYNVSGLPVTWSDPDTGITLDVTPLQTFRSRNGVYCREYEMTLTIGDKVSPQVSFACRNEDRKWESTAF